MSSRLTSNWYRFHRRFAALAVFVAAVAVGSAHAQIPAQLAVTSSANYTTSGTTTKYDVNPTNVPPSAGYTGIPGPSKVVGLFNGSVYYADESNDYGGVYYIAPNSIVPTPVIVDAPGTTNVLGGNRIASFDSAGNLYAGSPGYAGTAALFRIPNVNGTLNTQDAVDLLSPFNATPCNNNPLCTSTANQYLDGYFAAPIDAAVDNVSGYVYMTPVTCTTCNGEGVIFVMEPDGSSGNTAVYESDSSLPHAGLPGADGSIAYSMAIDPYQNLYYTDGTYIWQTSTKKASLNTPNSLPVPVQIGVGYPVVTKKYLNATGISLDANSNLWVNTGHSPCDCMVVFPFDPTMGAVNAANQYVSASKTYGQFAIGFGPFNQVYDGEGYEPTGDIRSSTLGSAIFGPSALNNAIFGETSYFTFNVPDTVYGISVTTGGNNSSPEFTIGSDPGTCTASSTGTAYKAGGACNVNSNWDPIYPGPRAGAVVLSDQNGNALGYSFLSGLGQGPAAALLPGVATQLLSNTSTVGGTSLSGPTAIAFDGSDNIYLADTGNNRIVEIPAAGGSPAVVNTSGTGMADPVSLTVDGAGNLYIADKTGGSQPVGKKTYTGQILEVTPQGVASVSIPAGTSFNGEYLNAPVAVSADNLGDVFILNGDGAILEQTPQLLRTVLLAPGLQFSGNALNGATAFSQDSTYDFVIADTGNNRIVEYSALTASAQVINTGSVIFTGPNGIAEDAAGDIYVTDGSGVGVIAPDGSVRSIPGIATSGASGIAIDPAGNLAVTDASGNSVFDLAVSSATITFADQAVGTTSLPESVTVFNIGNQPLNIASGKNPSVDPGDSNFQTAAGTCTAGSAVAPGASCTLSAVFTPQSSGSLSGSLILAANTVNGAVTIALKGNGSTLGGFVFSGLPATAPAGGTVSFTVTAIDAAGNKLNGYTGTVHFTSSDAAATLPADYTFTAADEGSHTFTATFNTSGNQTITVKDIKTGISSTSPPVDVEASAANIAVNAGSNQSTPLGQAFPVDLSVLVTDSNSKPVGGALVTFTAPGSGASGTFSGGGTVATAYTNSNGIATAPTFYANGIQGTYTVVASVTGVKGTANFMLTNSPGQTATTLSVTPASPTTYGQNITFAVTVSIPGSTSNAGPGGTVTVYDGSAVVATGTLVPVTPSNGTSTATITVPSKTANAISGGTHSFTATYSGDSNYASSTSTAVPYTVSLAPVSVTAPASLSGVQQQSLNIPITIAGEFSGPGIAAPSGTLSYTVTGDASGPLYTSPQSVAVTNGMATIVIPSTAPADKYTVQITYSGDINYQAVTTAVPLSITISGIALSDPTSTTLTTVPGQTVTTTLLVTPRGGYGCDPTKPVVNGQCTPLTETVTFSCTNLPTNVSCAFQPPTATFSGDTSSVAIVVDVSTASPPYISSIVPKGTTGSRLFLAGIWGLPGILLAGFVGFRRRRIPVWFRSAIILLVLGAGATGLTACGGVHSSASAGTYSFTVVANGTTSAGTKLSVTFPLTLQINESASSTSSVSLKQ